MVFLREVFQGIFTAEAMIFTRLDHLPLSINSDAKTVDGSRSDSEGVDMVVIDEELLEEKRLDEEKTTLLQKSHQVNTNNTQSATTSEESTSKIIRKVGPRTVQVPFQCAK